MREQSLARVLAVLRGRWRVLALVGVPIVLTSMWFAATRPQEYRSEVVVSFAPEPIASPDNSFTRLVPRYFLAVTDAEALRAAEIRAGLPQESLAGAVTAENNTNSLEMILTVTSESNRGSEVAAGALADQLLRAADDDPLVSARIVLGPTDSVDRAPTRQVLALTAGLLVAAVTGVSLVFVLEGAWPRLRVRGDVTVLGIPALPGLRRRDLRGRVHRRVRLPGARARIVDELPQLRLQVATAARGKCAGSLVVVAATAADAVLAEGVARALAHGSEANDGSVARASAAHHVRPLVRSWLPPGQPAQHEVAPGDCFLLVASSGTPVDQAHDCVRLLERQGGQAVGGLLVS